jgi:hypothetical protein
MPAIKLRHVATLVIALVTLAACDAEPIAPRVASALSAPAASAVTTAASVNTIDRVNATVPHSFVVFVSCANGGQGEVLQANGQLEYRGHWVTNAQGERVHHVAVSNFTGSAIGWDTGEAYDVVSRELSQGNIDYGNDGIPDSGEELQRTRLRLTSRASGATFSVVLVGRFVQTPSGDFVLDGWEGTARCN